MAGMDVLSLDFSSPLPSAVVRRMIYLCGILYLTNTLDL